MVCVSSFSRCLLHTEGVLVGALNETLVLGGGGTPIDVVGEASEATTATTSAMSVTWRAGNVTLLACAENGNCSDCVFDNAYRNVVPCRWCFDATSLDGRCTDASNLCVIGSQRSTVVVG